MCINIEKWTQHSTPSLYNSVCRFAVVQHETEGVPLHIQVLNTSVNRSICSTVCSYCSWNITSSSFLLTEQSSVSCTDSLCMLKCLVGNVWWAGDASMALHLESIEPYSVPAPRRWRSECKCRRRCLPGWRLQHRGGCREQWGVGVRVSYRTFQIWIILIYVNKHIRQIFLTLYVRGDQQRRSPFLISARVVHQMECRVSQTGCCSRHRTWTQILSRTLTHPPLQFHPNGLKHSIRVEITICVLWFNFGKMYPKSWCPGIVQPG